MLKGFRRGSPLLARQPIWRPSQRGLFLLWLATSYSGPSSITDRTIGIGVRAGVRRSDNRLSALWLRLTHLINDKDRCAAHRRGPVGGFAVADLKSRTRWRFNATTIGEVGHKSTLEDEYDMPPRAPVIGAVIRRELRQARA
jgi:hypothetical protein